MTNAPINANEMKRRRRLMCVCYYQYYCVCVWNVADDIIIIPGIDDINDINPDDDNVPSHYPILIF